MGLVVSTRSVNGGDFGGDTDLIAELARGNCVAYDRATAEYLHRLGHPRRNRKRDERRYPVTDR